MFRVLKYSLERYISLKFEFNKAARIAIFKYRWIEVICIVFIFFILKCFMKNRISTNLEKFDITNWHYQYGTQITKLTSGGEGGRIR